MRRIQLERFLDELHAHAAANYLGEWSRSPLATDAIVSDTKAIYLDQQTRDYYGGELIAESVGERAALHIVSTQPKNIIALVLLVRFLLVHAPELAAHELEVA
jgi:hypothetical protein